MGVLSAPRLQGHSFSPDFARKVPPIGGLTQWCEHRAQAVEICGRGNWLKAAAQTPKGLVRPVAPKAGKAAAKSFF
jgi:hypothetical protein